jgi:hypothetical protein
VLKLPSHQPFSRFGGAENFVLETGYIRFRGARYRGSWKYFSDLQLLRELVWTFFRPKLQNSDYFTVLAFIRYRLDML